MVSREDLEAIGFSGFVSVGNLRLSNLSEVPRNPGVYVFLRAKLSSPDFISVSPGGRFKGKDPTVPVATLEQKWVSDSKVVYIGKAGHLGRPPTLRTRLKQYLDFGVGKPVGHWGGRYIWQLRDSADLLVCWQATEGRDPEDVELGLISAFRAAHTRLPFANLTKGTRRKSL